VIQVCASHGRGASKKYLCNAHPHPPPSTHHQMHTDPYAVSPATTVDSAIKTVEKVWSTNPINIRTLEEHGTFVVIGTQT
jgi:DNA/RNA endonuclease YhcR with UshA esterase domain